MAMRAHLAVAILTHASMCLGAASSTDYRRLLAGIVLGRSAISVHAFTICCRNFCVCLLLSAPHPSNLLCLFLNIVHDQAKVRAGHGEAVCVILNLLCDGALSNTPSIKFSQIEYPSDVYLEEAPIDDDEEVSADIADTVAPTGVSMCVNVCVLCDTCGMNMCARNCV